VIDCLKITAGRDLKKKNVAYKSQILYVRDFWNAAHLKISKRVFGILTGS
jgi:hypothetical protein